MVQLLAAKREMCNKSPGSRIIIIIISHRVRDAPEQTPARAGERCCTSYQEAQPFSGVSHGTKDLNGYSLGYELPKTPHERLWPAA